MALSNELRTLAAAAYAAGFRGSALSTMIAVGMGESGGRTYAHNPNVATGDNSYGLWQINMLGALGPDRRRRYNISDNKELWDPVRNALIAYDMFRTYGYQPWSAFKNGRYRHFLTEARQAARWIESNRNMADRQRVRQIANYNGPVARYGPTSTSSRSSNQYVYRSPNTAGSVIPTLKKGSKGEIVKTLQRQLGVTADGDFGPITENAVKNFQELNGLVVDGVVGFRTWNALGSISGGGNALAPGDTAQGRRELGLAGGQWFFPVRGATGSDFSNDWGNARGGGTRSHEGTDIFADRGTPVVATVSGVITKAVQTDSGLGGKRVWVKGDDGRWYYYAHLDGVNVAVGQRVTGGQKLGTVGNTGNARNTPPHLHFGVTTRGQASGYINPFPYLRSAAETGTTDISGMDPGMAGGGGDGGAWNPSQQTLEDYVLENYPTFFWMLDHPELGPIIRDAARNPISAMLLQGRIEQTDWWKNNSLTRRQMMQLREQDPAEYARILGQRRTEIDQLARDMGIELSRKQLDSLATEALNMDMTSQQLRFAIVAEGDVPGFKDYVGGRAAGEVAAAYANIENIRNGYFVSMSDNAKQNWVKKLIKGDTSFEAFSEWVEGVGVSRAPWLQPFVDRGIDFETGLSPYSQQLADMLEVSPGEVDFGKDSWLGVTKSKDGELNSIEQAKLQAQDRFYNRWNKTYGARQAAQGLTAAIAETFGARA